MTLYKDRYRAESTRLKGWDYSVAGYYFVTICTRDRECWLGELVDDVVRLSPVGKIVAEEWQKTAQVRKNVTIDEWVVMPNHLHGIVIISDKTPQQETPHRGVSTEEPDMARLRKGSLGAIIGQFKSVCTKRIWAADHDFAWQARFHDEIIRDDNMLVRVREYIRNNPLQWKLDQENPIHLSAI